MSDKSLSRVLECALLAVHVLLENGAETYRAEESATRICIRFGVQDPQVVALTTGAFISLSRDGEESVTGVRRVKKRGTDLSRIDEANHISRMVAQGALSLDEALAAFRALSRPAEKKVLLPIVAATFSSACFAVLFGGGWFDFAAAGLCGGLVQALGASMRHEDYFHFIISLLGGAIIALLATLLTALFPIGNQNAIIAGALMPLLPGLAMTSAIRDTMRGDLVSGVARGAEALLVSISLAAGVGVVLGANLLLAGWLP